MFEDTSTISKIKPKGLNGTPEFEAENGFLKTESISKNMLKGLSGTPQFEAEAGFIFFPEYISFPKK